MQRKTIPEINPLLVFRDPIRVSSKGVRDAIDQALHRPLKENGRRQTRRLQQDRLRSGGVPCHDSDRD